MNPPHTAEAQAIGRRLHVLAKAFYGLDQLLPQRFDSALAAVERLKSVSLGAESAGVVARAAELLQSIHRAYAQAEQDFVLEEWRYLKARSGLECGDVLSFARQGTAKKQQMRITRVGVINVSEDGQAELSYVYGPTLLKSGAEGRLHSTVCLDTTDWHVAAKGTPAADEPRG